MALNALHIGCRPFNPLMHAFHRHCHWRHAGSSPFPGILNAAQDGLEQTSLAKPGP
jgi:hypothetical protein